jgi:hypothetical protein
MARNQESQGVLQFCDIIIFYNFIINDVVLGQLASQNIHKMLCKELSTTCGILFFGRNVRAFLKLTAFTLK